MVRRLSTRKNNNSRSKTRSSRARLGIRNPRERSHGSMRGPEEVNVKNAVSKPDFALTSRNASQRMSSRRDEAKNKKGERNQIEKHSKKEKRRTMSRHKEKAYKAKVRAEVDRLYELVTEVAGKERITESEVEDRLNELVRKISAGKTKVARTESEDTTVDTNELFVSTIQPQSSKMENSPSKQGSKVGRFFKRMYNSVARLEGNPLTFQSRSMRSPTNGADVSFSFEPDNHKASDDRPLETRGELEEIREEETGREQSPSSDTNEKQEDGNVEVSFSQDNGPEVLVAEDKCPEAPVVKDKSPEAPVAKDKRSKSPVEKGKCSKSPVEKDKRPEASVTEDKHPEAPASKDKHPDTSKESYLLGYLLANIALQPRNEEGHQADEETEDQTQDKKLSKKRGSAPSNEEKRSILKELRLTELKRKPSRTDKLKELGLEVIPRKHSAEDPTGHKSGKAQVGAYSPGKEKTQGSSEVPLKPIIELLQNHKATSPKVARRYLTSILGEFATQSKRVDREALKTGYLHCISKAAPSLEAPPVTGQVPKDTLTNIQNGNHLSKVTTLLNKFTTQSPTQAERERVLMKTNCLCPVTSQPAPALDLDEPSHQKMKQDKHEAILMKSSSLSHVESQVVTDLPNEYHQHTGWCRVPFLCACSEADEDDFDAVLQTVEDLSLRVVSADSSSVLLPEPVDELGEELGTIINEVEKSILKMQKIRRVRLTLNRSQQKKYSSPVQSISLSFSSSGSSSSSSSFDDDASLDHDNISIDRSILSQWMDFMAGIRNRGGESESDSDSSDDDEDDSDGDASDHVDKDDDKSDEEEEDDDDDDKNDSDSTSGSNHKDGNNKHQMYSEPQDTTLLAL